MTNPFAAHLSALSGPARDIVPIVPDDNVELPHVAVSLYVEAGGTIRFEAVAGGERTLDAASFSLLPVGVRKVFATGTDVAVKLHALVL